MLTKGNKVYLASGYACTYVGPIADQHVVWLDWVDDEHEDEYRNRDGYSRNLSIQPDVYKTLEDIPVAHRVGYLRKTVGNMSDEIDELRTEIRKLRAERDTLAADVERLKS